MINDSLQLEYDESVTNIEAVLLDTESWLHVDNRHEDVEDSDARSVNMKYYPSLYIIRSFLRKCTFRFNVVAEQLFRLAEQTALAATIQKKNMLLAQRNFQPSSLFMS